MTLQNNEILTFSDVKRLTKLVFSPAGFMVQLKNKDNIILWEDEKTVQLRGDKRGKDCYYVNFGRSATCPYCTGNDSINTMVPRVKEDRSIIDGKWYRAIAIPVQCKGEIVAVELIQDITAEKVTDNLLSSLISTGTLFGDIIHHDIPNYLSIVNFALDSLIDQSFDETESRTTLDIAKKNTMKAILILNEIKNLSLLETPLLQFFPVNIISILEETITAVHKIFTDKKIMINLNLNVDKDLTVVLANNLLSEIFLNLFTNAVKYTPEEEVEIIVSVDLIIRDREFLEIKISDKGKGISPDIKEVIFNRRKRISRGWKPTVNSTGIGVIIIKSLCDLFEAEISYKNLIVDDWTKGTVIKILFPLAKQIN